MSEILVTYGVYNRLPGWPIPKDSQHRWETILGLPARVIAVELPDDTREVEAALRAEIGRLRSRSNSMTFRRSADARRQCDGIAEWLETTLAGLR